MPLSREVVEHVAWLAHVGLDPAEIEAMTHELSSVIDHVAALSTVDTSQVEPTAYAVPMANVWRDDEVVPSWPAEGVLANAPQRAGDFFEVQAILD